MQVKHAIRSGTHARTHARTHAQGFCAMQFVLSSTFCNFPAFRGCFRHLRFLRQTHAPVRIPVLPRLCSGSALVRVPVHQPTFSQYYLYHQAARFGSHKLFVFFVKVPRHQTHRPCAHKNPPVCSWQNRQAAVVCYTEIRPVFNALWESR